MAPKPKNQGNAGKPNTQPPKTSGKPAKGGEPKQTKQDKRGFHSGGTHGSR